MIHFPTDVPWLKWMWSKVCLISSVYFWFFLPSFVHSLSLPFKGNHVEDNIVHSTLRQLWGRPLPIPTWQWHQESVQKWVYTICCGKTSEVCTKLTQHLQDELRCQLWAKPCPPTLSSLRLYSDQQGCEKHKVLLFTWMVDTVHWCNGTAKAEGSGEKKQNHSGKDLNHAQLLLHHLAGFSFGQSQAWKCRISAPVVTTKD